MHERTRSSVALPRAGAARAGLALALSGALTGVLALAGCGQKGPLYLPVPVSASPGSQAASGATR